MAIFWASQPNEQRALTPRMCFAFSRHKSKLSSLILWNARVSASQSWFCLERVHPGKPSCTHLIDIVIWTPSAKSVGSDPKVWRRDAESTGGYLDVWLQSRSLSARGRMGLEVQRCLCINARNVFISTATGPVVISTGYTPRLRKSKFACAVSAAKLLPCLQPRRGCT